MISSEHQDHLERLVTEWKDHYLPQDCGNCGRRRLEYAVNINGNVILIRCEKCGDVNWDHPSRKEQDASR